jgi:hypothetical protein
MKKGRFTEEQIIGVLKQRVQTTTGCQQRGAKGSGKSLRKQSVRNLPDCAGSQTNGSTQ